MRWKITVMTLLLTSGAVWNACAAESDDSDSYFPIWGDEARARGYSIPLPFGVNLSYMNMRRKVTTVIATFPSGETKPAPAVIPSRCRLASISAI
ncbi:hypothetical protein ACRR7Q_000242 [Klebsiella aerogenes]